MLSTSTSTSASRAVRSHNREPNPGQSLDTNRDKAVVRPHYFQINLLLGGQLHCSILWYGRHVHHFCFITMNKIVYLGKRLKNDFGKYWPRVVEKIRAYFSILWYKLSNSASWFFPIKKSSDSQRTRKGIAHEAISIDLDGLLEAAAPWIAF